MKLTRIFAGTTAFLVMIAIAMTSTSSAQTRVAILDVGTVFKNHPQFSSQLKALQQEAEQFKTTSIQAQQALMQKAEVLKQYKAGSLDYKNAESKLAQESAAMEVDQRDKMRALMQREAKLHFDTYEQVKMVVENYCDQRGIQLVIRYNSLEMDPKNTASVMQRVNGNVVYHNQQNDITQVILGQIRQLSGTASAGAGNLK